MKYRLRMAVQNPGRSGELFLSALNYIVFAVCGLLDKLLCPVFCFLDWQVDRSSTPCHCAPHPSSVLTDGESVYNALDFWRGPSHTLYERQSKWSGRRNGDDDPPAVGASRIATFVRRWKRKSQMAAVPAAVERSTERAPSKRLRPTSWSDCACKTCTAWLTKDSLLYVHTDCKGGFCSIIGGLCWLMWGVFFFLVSFESVGI